MAIAATTNWRIRPGANNANGGGFDPAVAGVLSTTLNGTINNTTTTIVVASATGWPGSGNYYARIGSAPGVVGLSEVVQVTAGQGTTTWTVTRGVLGTAAASFPTGVLVDNELSCCNTAPASGTAGTSTASTTFSDTGATFDLTCVGNIIWIASGTGATVGPYVIQSRTNGTTVVLDRASGTYTAGVWKMGGAWADFFNVQSTGPALVPGNKVYVLGTVVPNPAAYTYDYVTGSFFTPASGSSTTGRIRFIGDPATPNYAVGGRPCIQAGASRAAVFYNAAFFSVEALYFVSGVADTSPTVLANGQAGVIVRDCVHDQFGYDVGFAGGPCLAINNEVFSSVAARGTTAQPAFTLGTYAALCAWNNIKNTVGPGIVFAAGDLGEVCFNIISNVTGIAVDVADQINTSYRTGVFSNTINGGTGTTIGINIQTQIALACTAIFNNIIANLNAGGAIGLKVAAGTTAQNSLVASFMDFNFYFNNTANLSGINAGPNDVNLGATPFVNSAAGDFTLVPGEYAVGYPRANFMGY